MAREAVVAEIHRTLRRAGLIAYLVAVELVLTVAVIIDSAGVNFRGFNDKTIWAVFGAISAVRKEWPEETLLAVPFAILLPAVLTVTLSAPPGFGGQSSARREQAHFELLQWILGVGLVVAAMLSGLLILPYDGADSAPIVVLSMCVTAACCLLSQMLLGAPTKRTMQLSSARSKADAWRDSLDRTRASITRQAESAGCFLGGWRSGCQLAGLVILATGLPPVVVLASLMFATEDPSLVPSLAFLIPMGLTAGFTGYLVAEGVSCLRVSPTWTERADSFSSFVLPVVLAALLLWIGVSQYGEQGWWLFVFIACCASPLPMAVGYCLSRTLFGSCLEYRYIRRQAMLADAKVTELEAYQGPPPPPRTNSAGLVQITIVTHSNPQARARPRGRLFL